MKLPFFPLAYLYIGLSLMSLLYIVTLAWYNPNLIMAMVDVELSNTDSVSSIRGVYGSVGLTLIAMFAYLTRTNLGAVLFFLTLFWGLYALSRIITEFVDGPLGDFGNNWIRIESAFCFSGALLLLLKHRK